MAWNSWVGIDALILITLLASFAAHALEEPMANAMSEVAIVCLNMFITCFEVLGR